MTTERAHVPSVPLEMPIEIIGGAEMVRDSGGGLTPLKMVKPQHQLEDQTVRRCMDFAVKLSAEVARFRLHTMDDVVEFQQILAEKYGAKRGGEKGNITLSTFDGLMRVQVQTQSIVTYGAELQQAKALVDEFIAEKSGGVDEELLSLIKHAFQADQEGKINRGRLVQLKRLNIDNPTWKRAMEALNDAERPAGSRAYVRFGVRESVESGWTSVTIDIASA